VEEQVLVGKVRWYRVKDSRCWIYGPATFPWNPNNREPVAFAILDRLTKKDVRFEDFLAAEKFMVDNFGWKLDGQNAGVSARLRFKILQMLDTAASFEDSSSPAFRSWQELHGGLLQNGPEPDQSYVGVPKEVYWKLFEANRREPWSEELVWYISNLPAFTDECYTECVLGRISGRQAVYWTRFPRGAHIRDALRDGAEEAKYAAAMACDNSDPTLFAQTSVDAASVKTLRDTLAQVTDPLKQDVLKSLDEIARKCRK
jgi:hypothetical protein